MIRLQDYRSRLDRGAPRWKEAAWVICKTAFFLPRVPLPSVLRCTLLRAFGATVGRGVVIRGGVNITFPWRLAIGNHVWIGEGATLLNLALIAIGDDCCISQEAYLCTGSHDFRSPGFELITKPISVGSGTWIAARAFIGPGVELGDGAMACAGSIVTRSFPAGSILQGNPATPRPAPGMALPDEAATLP